MEPVHPYIEIAASVMAYAALVLTIVICIKSTRQFINDLKRELKKRKRFKEEQEQLAKH